MALSAMCCSLASSAAFERQACKDRYFRNIPADMALSATCCSLASSPGSEPQARISTSGTYLPDRQQCWLPVARCPGTYLQTLPGSIFYCLSFYCRQLCGLSGVQEHTCRHSWARPCTVSRVIEASYACFLFLSVQEHTCRHSWLSLVLALVLLQPAMWASGVQEHTRRHTVAGLELLLPLVLLQPVMRAFWCLGTYLQIQLGSVLYCLSCYCSQLCGLLVFRNIPADIAGLGHVLSLGLPQPAVRVSRGKVLKPGYLIYRQIKRQAMISKIHAQTKKNLKKHCLLARCYLLSKQYVVRFFSPDQCGCQCLFLGTFRTPQKSLSVRSENP